MTDPRGALIIAVNADNLLSTAAGWNWPAIALVAIPALLVLAAIVAARSRRPDRKVTLMATVIGLGWSAQGMWDVSVHTYHVVPQLAAVLFILFEAFLVGRMLNANLYRADRQRRARPVRFVWSLALIMGAVVALGEGWQQAPLRFAVPILVAWNWYLDLTADDDPAAAVRTSWRWTPRRLLLAVGALEPGARDAVTIDRDRHVAKMTALKFKLKYDPIWLNDLLRRQHRLARLILSADDGMVAEAHARMARIEPGLSDGPPVEPKSAPEQKTAQIVIPQPDRLPQGVHRINGMVLRGAELKADAIYRMRQSMTPARPQGMPAADLAALYSPALKTRTADGFAAAARQVNGKVPEGLAVE